MKDIVALVAIASGLHGLGCTGAKGDAAAPLLFRSTAIQAGDHGCETGGVLVEMGPDDDPQNGALDDSERAHDVALCHGPRGDQGIQGEEGDQGDKGDKGDKGDQGDRGAVGLACWDLDGNGAFELASEDKNNDGVASALDCQVATYDARLTALEASTAALSERLATVESGLCPRGYTLETDADDTNDGAWIVCKKDMEDTDGNPWEDEVVKVGDFWIDRYELGWCWPTGHGDPNGENTTFIGCSRRGATVLPNATWFQAAQMCANAGKRMCTNSEWQTAVAGTPDGGPRPDTNEVDGCSGSASSSACNTCAGELGKAGQAQTCVSRFGAFDMIGNAWEWVAWWSGQGPNGDRETILGSFYGDDGLFNVDPAAGQYDGEFQASGLPAAALRGGFFSEGSAAGAFAIALNYAPSYDAGHITSRCCIGGN